jgi:hypothetical protein
MRAAVGVEGAEQPLFGDCFEQPEKARHRALFLDQDGRVDRAGRIVEGDDQIEIVVERADPTVGRAVLEQQHAGQRPPFALFAMSATAPLVLDDEASSLQRQPGHRVAERVVVPLLQLLVKMLHREVAVALLIEDLHTRQLTRRRPPR